MESGHGGSMEVLSWWLSGVHRPTRLPGWGTRIGHGGLMEPGHGGSVESCPGGSMESIGRHDYLAGTLGLVMVACWSLVMVA